MKYKNIAIERQYGSGGRGIARQVAEKLDITCYGEEILRMAAERSGVPAEYLAGLEEAGPDPIGDTISLINKMFYHDGTTLSNKDRLADLEGKIITEIADKESCVFIGRGSAFILGDRRSTLSVFVYADFDFRKNHAIANYGIDEWNADKVIKSIDKKRANHYSSYRKLVWGEKEGYDLMLNSGELGIDRCIDLIVEIVKSS